MALRDRWDSRKAFIFAAAGSAAGLGNLWRFPYLAYKFGGGAFLLPYLLILLLLGIPLLILEIALGQRFQKGAVDSFRSVHKKLGGVGLFAILGAFVIVSYYMIVIGWSLLYFIYSWTLKWGTDPKTFFFNSVLDVSEGISHLNGFNPAILVATAVVWVLVYLCVRRGVKSVGKVVMVTMPLPILLLIILLVRGVTLPGSAEGILLYLTPDFSLLASTDLWIAAISQIFFTLSLAFGVMIAYSSFNDKNEDIVSNSLWTAGIDTAVSLIAGFAVFGTLGYMALQQGVGVTEVMQAGPSLAFIVFPQALSLLPFWAPFFAAIFFLTLLTLGIDSAFSLVEAVTTVIHDSSKKLLNKRKVAAAVCFIGFLLGLIFTTRGGLFYLDVVDHFITNFGLVLVGLAECILIGWVLGADKLREYINSVSKIKLSGLWDFLIKYLAPVGLGFLLVTQFLKEIQAPYSGYPLWAIWIGLGTVIVPILIGLWFSFRFQKRVHA